ncbi:adhesion G protein-coupled receptor B2-like [Centruroides sculpturatus]|uniref:adhesion G protein-coupled receptor B2-like n=1 Tax=Centruroides sculpturatus TaxID=218467 RepID=UPI000C6CBC35|nr:adhesion G protein-coupled receptor B2-like [Centruroides sculpturatus]
MFFNECLAHVSSEFALLGAYTCILITTCESYYISYSLCLAISIFLQFFFLVVFTCHLLEIIVISRLLLSWFPYIFINRCPLLTIGWGLPAAITILTVIVAHDNYITSSDNCWMNVDNGIKWVTIIPIGICVGVHILLLLMVLVVKDIPSNVRRQDVKRARNALSARWASAIIIIFLTLVWSTGLMATNRNSEAFFGVFCVITIILGAMVLILRISTEAEVRKRITSAFTSSPVLVTQQPLWISTSFDSESHSVHNHMPKTPVRNSPHLTTRTNYFS